MSRPVAEAVQAACEMYLRLHMGPVSYTHLTEKTGTLSTLQDQTLFQPVYCLAGNIIDRSETAGANGSGVKENPVSYTHLHNNSTAR